MIHSNVVDETSYRVTCYAATLDAKCINLTTPWQKNTREMHDMKVTAKYEEALASEDKNVCHNKHQTSSGSTQEEQREKHTNLSPASLRIWLNSSSVEKETIRVTIHTFRVHPYLTWSVENSLSCPSILADILWCLNISVHRNTCKADIPASMNSECAI